jgi:outer membrane receptor protein involved in Fe transport
MNGSSTFLPEDITSSEQHETEIGFFGRLNYDYKGKYLLTATFREDGSSKFAKENRWGFFPGVSAGWVISEESWMKSLHQLNFLKLRASYGSTGNNASVGIYDAYGSFGAGYIYNGNAGIKPSDMPNNELQWETSNQLDLGLEAGLFKNRVYISADFFDKRTENLLYEQTLPNTTGYSKYWTNLGKVRFYGYELELTTRNIVKKNFSWETKLVLSYQKNEVLELPENGIDKNRTGGIALGDGTFFGGIAEGEPLGRFYGYVATGIIQNEQQAANAYYGKFDLIHFKISFFKKFCNIVLFYHRS